jgi:arsenate reductase
MKNVTIYHNPRCSKSRQTLALLEQHGITPTIISYLDSPPNEDTLRSLLKLLAIKPRELLRKSESEYKTLDLDDPTLSDTALIKIMVAHPKLIERPIVVTNKKAVLGRPPEKVLEILND